MAQTSITMFFKSKQQDKQENDSDNKDKDKDDLIADNTPTKDLKNSAKRPAKDDDDETPSKRVALTPHSTPGKRLALTPQSTPKTNTKTDETIVTPEPKKLAMSSKTHGDLLKPCSSPLMDVNVLIRAKISSGSFALHENIGKSWFKALQGEFDKPYFKNLSKFVQQQRSTKTVYPPENKVYAWTHHHDIKDTRVIILGQDPYHGPGQAHGLSFSVQKGVRIPPSLVNIFKELSEDIPGFVAPTCGDLTGWAKQGVLLLNTCLSVNQGQANSHQNKGWETFTDAVISWISKNIKHKVVFLLWGTPAKKKSNMIDKRHKVLTAVHPSPLSAHNGFFGCKHFSQTNAFLRQQGLPEVDWKNL